MQLRACSAFGGTRPHVSALVFLLFCFISSPAPLPVTAKCDAISIKRLQRVALNGTLLVTAVDHLLWNVFGPSWVQSVQTAAIKYWLIVAIGDDAAAAISAAGYGGQCMLVPKPTNVSKETTVVMARRSRSGGGAAGRSGQIGYEWLSSAWQRTTWVKVAVVASLVEMGFNVLHSDIDVTWFQDPLPVLLRLATPPSQAAAAHATPGSRAAWLAAAAGPGPTVLFSTDLLTTLNPATNGEDSGLEMSCDPSYSLNTGVFLVSGSEAGARLMRSWLAVRAAGFSGDDQQALNVLVRGTAMPLHHVPLPVGYDIAAATTGVKQQIVQGGGGGRGGSTAGASRRDVKVPKRLGVPWPRQGPLRHTYFAAGAPGVAGAEAEGVVVSCLPVSSFSHTYTFATSRLHLVRSHLVYEVHWVWGGRSLESKRQCMRDALAFVDPPEYYSPQRIMTFELEHVEMPPAYNDWPASRTAEMVSFALGALSAQLQQAYWALAMAMALNRTLVLPEFRCYCAKNWFVTTACRITNERDTVFPFPCPLSHVFRAKLLLEGQLRVPDPQPHPRLRPVGQGGGSDGGERVAEVRERPFLSNPRTDAGLRSAIPTVLRVRHAPTTSESDAVKSGSSGREGPEVVLDGPVTDRELQDLLLAPPYDSARVLHVPRPATVLSGFADNLMWHQYDIAVQRVTATWCCRSATDAKAFGGSRKERLQALPPSRKGNGTASGGLAAAVGRVGQ